ncbi:hypothetical protein V1512DRAFT_259187 [Lipomyces arxii]|uniref:uncharacterized protein n=1 Tax=Lipomyces arxii TaxID=56418 RepID=UPI0034CEAE53
MMADPLPTYNHQPHRQQQQQQQHQPHRQQQQQQQYQHQRHQQPTMPSLLHPPISTPNYYSLYQSLPKSDFSAAASSPYTYHSQPNTANSVSSGSTNSAASSDVSLPPLRMHINNHTPSPPLDPPLAINHSSTAPQPPPPQVRSVPYYQPLPPLPHSSAPNQARAANMHLTQVAAAQVAATLADVTVRKPAKEIKRRTKTGCLTCRKRRIKCDERHPMCFNCSKSKRVCLGYDPILKPQRLMTGKRDDKDSNRSGSDSPTMPSPSSKSHSETSTECSTRIKIDSLLTE